MNRWAIYRISDGLVRAIVTGSQETAEGHAGKGEAAGPITQTTPPAPPPLRFVDGHLEAAG